MSGMAGKASSGKEWFDMFMSGMAGKASWVM